MHRRPSSDPQSSSGNDSRHNRYRAPVRFTSRASSFSRAVRTSAEPCNHSEIRTVSLQKGYGSIPDPRDAKLLALRCMAFQPKLLALRCMAFQPGLSALAFQPFQPRLDSRVWAEHDSGIPSLCRKRDQELRFDSPQEPVRVVELVEEPVAPVNVLIVLRFPGGKSDGHTRADKLTGPQLGPLCRLVGLLATAGAVAFPRALKWMATSR